MLVDGFLCLQKWLLTYPYEPETKEEERTFNMIKKDDTLRQFLLNKMILLSADDEELRSNFVKHLNNMSKNGTNWYQVYLEEAGAYTPEDNYTDPEMDNQRLPGRDDLQESTDRCNA